MTDAAVLGDRTSQGVDEVAGRERMAFALPLAAAAIGAAVGLGALLANAIDAASLPAVGLLGASQLASIWMVHRWTGSLDRRAVALLVFSLVAAVVLYLAPEWMFGWNINGIIHHSVLSVPLLLLLSTAIAANSVRVVIGGTPSGRDLSLYPWLMLPILLALIAYGMLIGYIVASGIGGLNVTLLTTVGAPAGNGYMPGFLNNILGTFLLMSMTLLIAFLPGVGAGVFMAEYPGRLAALIDFCTQMLRAVSMFVIGAAAFGLVNLLNSAKPDDLLSQLVRGSYAGPAGQVLPERGSFLFAAVILGLLVMPVIAKLTEEGLRSVPREIREGSIALGATECHGRRRILLPWAAPNILTGLVLAAAEANGSLAVLVFLGVIGDNGVGPLSGVTSLDYSIFEISWGPMQYTRVMDQYRLTAALVLLLLTMGLTVIAMLLQRRFAKRYRGSLTSN